MKRPEYVAVVTRIYSRLLEEGRSATPAERAELEQAFSRSGFTDWYWQGRHGAGMFGVRPENAQDPKALFDEARAAYEKDNLRTVPVRFTCVVKAGAPAALTAEDGDGHTVTVTGPVPEAARNRAVTAEELCQRLGKTGGTAYRCESASADVDDGLSLPASAVNALRRDALAALTEERVRPPVRRELPIPDMTDIDCSADAPQLTVSVATADQLSRELLDCGPARVYVPLEELVRMGKLPPADTEWCAILPRVWRDRDEPLLLEWLEMVKAMGVSSVLVGNIGHLPLARAAGMTMHGDYGMNVFNGRSVDYLRQKGLSSACLSFELRFAQMRDLPKALPTEAIVYGHLPLMLFENCLIRASAGHCDCSRPRKFTDRTRREFLLLPAFGCRTALFNAVPLWLGDRRDDYESLGLHYARLSFTSESPAECVRILNAYRLGDEASGQFTRGLYVRGVE